jgi:hypothetical protein
VRLFGSSRTAEVNDGGGGWVAVFVVLTVSKAALMPPRSFQRLAYVRRLAVVTGSCADHPPHLSIDQQTRQQGPDCNK